MPTTTKKKDDQDPPPSTRTCATDQVHERLLREEPGYATRRALSEDQAWRAQLTKASGRTGCTKIPVVVHVVHRTDAENVSAAQVTSQIDVLNEDFRKKNADVSDLPAAFDPLAADARISFELASTDPAGNPTDGITRTRTTVAGFGHDDAMKSAATGGADAWPADRYLNIWVCQLAGGLLGYAQFPGGPAATDGVVVRHSAFGRVGTATAPFDQGRTTTHEIGHWLNLRHIWGDDGSGCSGSDFVDDTPNQGGANVGKPTYPTISCMNGPDGDLFMNYMDYVDDDTMVMFTAGQVVRMQAALDGFRSSIGSTVPCGVVKTKFADDPILTLKFRDDPGSLKFADDPIVTLKFRDDVGSLKFADDPVVTLKFRDDLQTDPRRDLLKSPVVDTAPTADIAGPVGPGVPGPGPGLRPGAGTSGAAPFVLATPHHSMAWAGSYPDAYASTRAAYEQQLEEYERVLREYVAASESGRLGEEDRAAAEQLHAEYQRLGAEYEQTFGAGA